MSFGRVKQLLPDMYQIFRHVQNAIRG
jgi:hypothetical protein